MKLSVTRSVNNKYIYTLYIRSILEQSAVVWNSGITEENKNDLERVQKTHALKLYTVHDNYHNYESALQRANLMSLSDRRKKLCLKFAKKCLNNLPKICSLLRQTSPM